MIQQQTTITMKQNNMFAFGNNVVTEDDIMNNNGEIINCPCPATKAGYNPDNDDIIHVAEAYDDIIRDQYHGDFTGIINESTAKEAWNKAIQEVLNKEDYDHIEHSIYDQSVSQAENVKEVLDWD
jgi:glucose-6-phosphate 1-dehydrogenase